MPELPEVETIRLGLHRKIVGLKITKIQILSPKSFLGNPNKLSLRASALKAQGQKVLKVWRRAKILGIDLDGVSLLIHLKMTGQLIYDGGKRPALPDGSRGRIVGGHPTPDMRDKMPNSHTRVTFSFSDGSHLYFNDQRRFGWVKIMEASKGKIVADEIAENLGPEPLEKGFTWQILKTNLLKHKSQSIKVAIMDQKTVSGVGNIYASEACFNAKLDPRTKVSELSDLQLKKLHSGIVKSLQDGIKHGGSSRAHFVDSEGHKGYFLDYAFVYGRDKHPCKICKTEIKKITLGQRGTYYCPKCQK